MPSSICKGCSVVATILVACASVVLYQTSLLPTYQFTADHPALAGLKLVADSTFTGYDFRAATDRLGQVLRVKTVSITPNVVTSPQGFLQLHEMFEKFYPAVHKHLSREIINEYSLLFKWKGIDADPINKPPYLLMSHLDVVPASNDTLKDWTYEPFSGIVMPDDSDGKDYLYGRGAIDVKQGVTSPLEAVEWMLTHGGITKPKRTLYLFFGHDEETGGRQGAMAAVEHLKSKHGISKLDFVVDEGGMVTQGVVSFTQKPVALIGIGEKGYLSVDLDIEQSGGGHSSMPPIPHTAVKELAEAIVALETNQMPASLRTVSHLLSFVAPELPFVSRMAIANPWLFESLLVHQLSGSPAQHANTRTTTAPTMLQGSAKDNVLPLRPKATINFRIQPGDTIASVVEHVRRTVNNPKISVRIWNETAQEATSMSNPHAPQFQLLQATLKQLLPEVVAAPYLVIGGTDARHFNEICENVYRFIPYVTKPNDITRYHGINERISLTDIETVIRWYYQLITNADNA